MTNPYGGYGMPPNFQMPNLPQFQGMPQFQGGNPQDFGQGVRSWAQGLGNQFRGMMSQGGQQGGYGTPLIQGQGGGYQNRLLNQGGGMGGWRGFRGQGQGGYGQ